MKSSQGQEQLHHKQALAGNIALAGSLGGELGLVSIGDGQEPDT